MTKRKLNYFRITSAGEILDIIIMIIIIIITNPQIYNSVFSYFPVYPNSYTQHLTGSLLRHQNGMPLYRDLYRCACTF